MTNVIEENLLEIETEKLFQLLRQNHVSKAYLFGSVTTSRFSKEKSDIDIIIELVDMPPLEKGETLIRLWEELEAFFGRKVDLVTDQPLKNPYFKKSLEETKVLIYDRKSEKVLV
ncbi:MAG: nucleotidyltransferase domain-containing protein [Phaeodactylibacter sp.]|nr:nucleotidyltransferase domain-containing protein [Phaeodactylibacter sp.]